MPEAARGEERRESFTPSSSLRILRQTQHMLQDLIVPPVRGHPRLPNPFERERERLTERRRKRKKGRGRRRWGRWGGGREEGEGRRGGGGGGREREREREREGGREGGSETGLFGNTSLTVAPVPPLPPSPVAIRRVILPPLQFFSCFPFDQNPPLRYFSFPIPAFVGGRVQLVEQRMRRTGVNKGRP
jgi:hypothetical protein